MNDLERSVIDPGIRSGKPCIRGTCIAVSDILNDLTADDIRACFALATDRDRRRKALPHQAAL